jgi:hypothetical protein
MIQYESSRAWEYSRIGNLKRVYKGSNRAGSQPEFYL